MKEQIDVEHLQWLTLDAIAAALSAGEVVMDLYQETAEVEVKLKADSTPRPEADRKADDCIRNSLLRTFIPLLSEEGREVYYDERRDWDYFWLVDPLDGTKEFINTSGEFTINIALIENVEAIVGVVFVPVQQKLYYAVRGAGSFCVEKFGVQTHLEGVSWADLQKQSQRLPRVKRGPTEWQQEFVVTTSRSHLAERTREYVKKLSSMFPKIREVECGSSYKMCMVAEGTADLYPRVTATREWDTAAGQAVVEMADMEVVDFTHFGRLYYNKESMVNPSFVVRPKFLTIPKLSQIEFE